MEARVNSIARIGSSSRRVVILILALAALVIPASGLIAQDWKKPFIKHLQRLDLRFLGYPEVNEIPAASSFITSLLTARDGNIYGATTGDTAYLFVFEPTTNKVRHLGKVGGEQSVHHALAEDGRGNIYLGTGLNQFTGIKFSGAYYGDRSIDLTLWKDVKDHYAGYAGGHIYRYNPAESNNRVKLADMQCDLEDLGIPLPGNSVYAMTADPEGGKLYMITYPDGHFIVCDIATGAFSDKGEIDTRHTFHGPERHWRSLPRALAVGCDGKVYTSGEGGFLIHYDPATDKIERTEYLIPGDRFPGEDVSHAVAECFAKAADGTIYGGGSDGHLFSFKPGEDDGLRNLGKPRSVRRIRGITAGKDGKIYLISGERTGTVHCMLHAWDPEKIGFEDLGLVIVDHSPHYYWRGLQFDAMVTGEDGTIFMGESDYRSHLFMYIP